MAIGKRCLPYPAKDEGVEPLSRIGRRPRAHRGDNRGRRVDPIALLPCHFLKHSVGNERFDCAGCGTDRNPTDGSGFPDCERGLLEQEIDNIEYGGTTLLLLS